MAGKGSSARPFSVDQKTFSDNWNKIFEKSALADRMQSEADLFSVRLPARDKDWYLTAINPWYKMYVNAKTGKHKKIPLEKG